MSATLDDVLAKSARLARDRLMIVTPDNYSLTYRPSAENKVFDFPRIDQVEDELASRCGSMVPWTGDVWRANIETELKVDGLPRVMWTPAVLLVDAPTLFTPSVLNALRQLDDPLVNATISGSGDTKVNASVQDLQRQLDALKRSLPASDRSKTAAHQAAADAVYRAFGDASGAPAPMHGESERDYVARLTQPYLKYSKRWAGHNLRGIGDVAIVSTIAAEVYADALGEAKRPTHYHPGELRRVTTTDASGRPRHEFVGDPNHWDAFSPGFRYVRRFNTSATR